MQNIVQQNNKPMWLISIIRNLTQYPLFHCNQKPEIDPSRIYKSHNSKIHQVQQNNALMWLICLICNLNPSPLLLAIKNLRGATQKYQSVSDKVLHCNQIWLQLVRVQSSLAKIPNCNWHPTNCNWYAVNCNSGVVGPSSTITGLMSSLRNTLQGLN